MKQDGLLNETLAKIKLLEAGLAVSQPIDPQSRYDLIADNGRRLFKIQVKGVGRKLPHRDGYRVRLYTCTKRAKEKNVRLVYTRHEVDMFLIYIKPLQIWYVIPQAFVNGKTDLSIYPNSKSIYDPFEGGWEIFLDNDNNSE